MGTIEEIEKDMQATSAQDQPYEWRRLVGSIRRRVQRHASGTSTDSPSISPSNDTLQRPTSLSRKSSLTFTRFSRENSKDSLTASGGDTVYNTGSKTTSDNIQPSSNQQHETRDDLFKSLKYKSKNVHFTTKKADFLKSFNKSKDVTSSTLSTNTIESQNITNKKTEIFTKVTNSFKSNSTKSSNSSSSSFKHNVNSNNKKELSTSSSVNTLTSKIKLKNGANNSAVNNDNQDRTKNVTRDDFLKATMRIFLVVSPPVAKVQIRSRSLTHLDELDPLMKCGGTTDSDTNGSNQNETLKDSKSEPNCTMSLTSSPSITTSTEHLRRDMLLTAQRTSIGGSDIDLSSNSRGPQQTTILPQQQISYNNSMSRRHRMVRSQVSSSEYFGVIFSGDDHLIYPREEFIPATRGVLLENALGPVCKARGIDICNCEVYLDNNGTPLPIQTLDVAYLSGKQLTVVVRDSSSKQQASSQKSHKLSSSYGSKSSYFSSSVDDSIIITNTTPILTYEGSKYVNKVENLKKKERQRWSGFFGNNKDTKMEQLVEQLNHYAKNGIPMSENKSEEDEIDCKELLNTIGNNWRQSLDVTKLSEKQQQQQTALWELITTEVDYIQMLRVVTNLFLACLKSLQLSNILIEVDKNKLFSNITEIHRTNVLFWRLHIYPMLKHASDTHDLLNPEYLLDGFIQFREIFDPYIKYCSEQSKCQHYCKEMHSQNELFTAYLVWCETQKECNRLRLMDILVRPMQRLTKYGLILKVIYKNSDFEHHKECLSAMIKSVDDFVNNVNFILKCRQDNESLKRMIARIESYEAVESKEDDLETIVRNHSNLDLTRPMLGCSTDRQRHLLLEDDLKLKDSTSSKIEVHCMLLTDLLLIGKVTTKKVTQSIRIIRQPYIVDRLIVTELAKDSTTMGLVYLNEFNMTIAAFILQGDSKKIKKWIDSIRKAQVAYRQAKSASAPMVRQQSVIDVVEPTEFNLELGIEDNQSLFGVSMLSRSPFANSSQTSRLSSLVHSHSGSMEMNDQSSAGSIYNPSSRAISVEADQRTASISSDEGVQSLPVEKSIKSPKSPLKTRVHSSTSAQMKISTPNTLSVQPYNNLGQSLPNLILGSPNNGTMSTYPTLHTLVVPNSRHHNQHLLSPSQRGISYPPPSPTRGNLRRGIAIPQSKNPPLLKTRHIHSVSGTNAPSLEPMNSDELDVPLISGIDNIEEVTSDQSTGIQNKQAIIQRPYRVDNRRYFTASIVEDNKKNDSRSRNIKKRLSWNTSHADQIEIIKPEDNNT